MFDSMMMMELSGMWILMRMNYGEKRNLSPIRNACSGGTNCGLKCGSGTGEADDECGVSVSFNFTSIMFPSSSAWDKLVLIL